MAKNSKIVGKAPVYETIPPHQEKYQHGTDDWNLATTGCPLDSNKINTLDNSQVLAHEKTVMAPAIIDGHSSPNIFRSMTDGRGRK